MDKKDLKDILGNVRAPAPDENAKKRALNLAMAEYESEKKKNQKNFQGLPILSRLMGSFKPNDRSKPMDKRFVYGGMATAMVVVLAVGASMTQLQSQQDRGTTVSVMTGGSTVSEPPGTEKLSQTMREATEEANIQRTEEAIKSSASALPPPIATPAEEPLMRWRKVQEERVAQAPGRQNTGAKRELEMAEVDAIADNPATAPAFQAPGKAKEGKDFSTVARNIVILDSDDEIAPTYYQDKGRDQFEDFEINPFKMVTTEPVSTFSVDVDTASYSFVRRQLNHGVLPAADAVRVEEMINYFDYDYPLPDSREQPFKPTVTVTPSPWANGKELIHIGIKGYDIDPDEKPRSNLVFLLDVSGSMNSPDKLPLLKQSMKMLLDSLDPDDTVAIAVYAGAAGTVLEPTKASEKRKIVAALERLSAGGSTAGAAGINLAYKLAEENFDDEAVNRVILATDGDFNVGITNREELKDFVERKRKSGIFLSVLGFGQGNLNDHMMQTLAQNGNGVAAYIDSLNEARKVLVDEATSTLFPIAKDVKIQVEFNPETVQEYRLVGYETRALNREDFNNDAVDAGDIGAGHTVTAIYEITPVGATPTVDPLRYGNSEPTEEKHVADSDFNNEYAFLKIRYKLPDEDTSTLITTPIVAQDEQVTGDAAFATAVASFAQLLKGGKYTGSMTYDDVIEMAQQGKGKDEFGYRSEFIQLVRLAKSANAMQ